MPSIVGHAYMYDKHYVPYLKIKKENFSVGIFPRILPSIWKLIFISIEVKVTFNSTFPTEGLTSNILYLL